MNWITKWEKLEENTTYLVCAINGSGRLYNPMTAKGWEVKRLKEGVYAAIELPPFTLMKTPTEECSPS